MGEHHIDMWDWLWSIRRGKRNRPFVAIWPRGGAKSSSAELGVATVGMRKKRKYTLYVCETQLQADKHVTSIGNLLENADVERAVSKYGQVRGWRRNRLRAVGFTVDGMGLDVASRGAKVDEDRPDFIVFDDIDGRHDTIAATLKKKQTLTETVLGTGSKDCTVLGIQNLIHKDSVFSQLADGRADFLSDRFLSGPLKALNNLHFEVVDGKVRLTAGDPVWLGQNLEDCQNFINNSGWAAFKRECQQEVGDAPGALWSSQLLDSLRVGSPPQLLRWVTALDPSGTERGTGDECGIVTAGIGKCNCKGYEELHAFVLEDASDALPPEQWAQRAVDSYRNFNADSLVAESNFGGALVSSTLKIVPDSPPVKLLHASHGKQARAEPVQGLYNKHQVHHVGNLPMLEEEMRTWEPLTGMPSPNRMDALVWAITELMLSHPFPGVRTLG